MTSNPDVSIAMRGRRFRRSDASGDDRSAAAEPIDERVTLMAACIELARRKLLDEEVASAVVSMPASLLQRLAPHLFARYQVGETGRAMLMRALDDMVAEHHEMSRVDKLAAVT